MQKESIARVIGVSVSGGLFAPGVNSMDDIGRKETANAEKSSLRRLGVGRFARHDDCTRVDGHVLGFRPGTADNGPCWRISA